MLPPTISTTPNSPTVCANVSVSADRNPRRASGTATLKNASSGGARSVAAASSTRGGMAANASRSGCTMKGSELITDATTRPQKLNTSGGRFSAASARPTAPCGPIHTSR